MFSHALLTNLDPLGIKLPWEQGIFAELLGESSTESLVPKMDVSTMCDLGVALEVHEVAAQVASASRPPAAGPLFVSVIRDLDDGDFSAKREALWESAVAKLVIVVSHCLPASAVGRHISDLGSMESQSAGAAEVVGASVGVRSPNTLIKRANSLLSFLRWSAGQDESPPNPFIELLVWKYLRSLRDSSASATKASAFVSALRFAQHVLGFNTLRDATSSRRVLGLAEQLLADKPLLRQAKVLTVSQVLRIHKALNDAHLHKVDRLAAAYILIALYGRCRHSDLEHVRSIHADFDERGGFLELFTAKHKTARAPALKAQLLPILVPATGVSGEVWATKAKEIFEEVGPSLSGLINGPLFPAPKRDAQAFCLRGVTSQEVSTLLRALVGEPEPVRQSARAGRFQAVPTVSSHSLKATCLSWAAKYGLNPATRSVLGRHSSATNESQAIYARDLAIGPTRELQSVLQDIVLGRFMPDAPRSAYFATFPPEIPLGRQHAELADQSAKQEVSSNADDLSPGVAEVLEVSSSGESDDSSSGASSSSDSERAPDPPLKVRRFRPKIPKEEVWYEHRKSRILHRLDVENSEFFNRNYLSCGKQVTESYVRASEGSAWNVTCKMCAKRRGG